ncbi:hypothetical protein [Paenarthrobacter sp. 2TAF44]|uniref:hypothetical protein n=1 Tax=Paenarthrobacter sp. 2TAF44 TaxID=3233018 RepID=UPI003F9C8027
MTIRTLQAGDCFPVDLLSINDDCPATTRTSPPALCSLDAGHDGQHVAADSTASPELANADTFDETGDVRGNSGTSTLTVVSVWD